MVADGPDARGETAPSISQALLPGFFIIIFFLEDNFIFFQGKTTKAPAQESFLEDSGATVWRYLPARRQQSLRPQPCTRFQEASPRKKEKKKKKKKRDSSEWDRLAPEKQEKRAQKNLIPRMARGPGTGGSVPGGRAGLFRVSGTHTPRPAQSPSRHCLSLPFALVSGGVNFFSLFLETAQRENTLSFTTASELMRCPRCHQN